MATVDLRTEIKEFLSSRRARITPARAGLPADGSHRRVAGLHRAEVALLAGVSVDYYVRMERGSLTGASDGVLDALASALQLDEAERDHLFHLARTSRTPGRPRRRRPAATVRPALQQVLDALTDAPARIVNGRYDVLAMNPLAHALYSPMLAGTRRPLNTARFVYLEPEAAERFFVDYDRIVGDVAAKLRMEAGRNPQCVSRFRYLMIFDATELSWLACPTGSGRRGRADEVLVVDGGDVGVCSQPGLEEVVAERCRR